MWKPLLGEPAAAGLGVELGEDEAEMDATLAALYEEQPRRRPGLAGDDRAAGLGASAPQVARWLGDIRTYFPTSVVQVMQRDAIERLNLTAMLLQPELLRTCSPTSTWSQPRRPEPVMPATTKETARAVVARWSTNSRSASREPSARRSLVRSTAPPATGAPYVEIDWPATIRPNLDH